MYYTSFLNFINERTILPPDTQEALLSSINILEIKKGDYLLKEGLTPHHLWFINSGSLRTFYYIKDKEITSWIYNEKQVVTSYGTFFKQTPSYEYIQATEDSEVISISHKNLISLYKEHPKMETFGRLLLEEIITSLDVFYKGFLFMTARQKYDMIVESFPDITHRVNLGYIASWLGITQETLSRIRGRR